MKLYLMRHGDAVHPQINELRPLSQKGRDEVLRVAQAFKAKEISLHSIAQSGLLRAQETAQIFQEAACPSCKTSTWPCLHPNDPVSMALDKITSHFIESPTQDIMIVGHLPFLYDLALELLHDQISPDFNFETAQIVCLESSKENLPTWHFRWTLSPQNL